MATKNLLNLLCPEFSFSSNRGILAVGTVFSITAHKASSLGRYESAAGGERGENAETTVGLNIIAPGNPAGRTDGAEKQFARSVQAFPTFRPTLSAYSREKRNEYHSTTTKTGRIIVIIRVY